VTVFCCFEAFFQHFFPSKALIMNAKKNIFSLKKNASKKAGLRSYPACNDRQKML
jgi:hypothetical protein